MIKAEMIADSISLAGARLTTMRLTYPRMIHSEFMTHRVFSKNSSSSRAIMTSRLIRSVMDNPAEPSEWGQNQKGMQAGKPLKGWRLFLAKTGWHVARRGAYMGVKLMQWSGAHKQVVNRPLEPWAHMIVVVTATEWDNFFMLRNHSAADPTMQELARAMWACYDGHVPRLLQNDEWHLPFVRDAEGSLEHRLTLSVARCAVVSYLNIGSDRPVDIIDAERIVAKLSGPPVHCSPFEHQALPDTKGGQGHWRNTRLHGNLRGWIQNRKTLKNG